MSPPLSGLSSPASPPSPAPQDKGETHPNSPVPKRFPHFFDLNRVHRLLREWKVGEQCKLTVRRDEFNSPEHAINYIVKYLIKMPDTGVSALDVPP